MRRLEDLQSRLAFSAAASALMLAATSAHAGAAGAVAAQAQGASPAARPDDGQTVAEVVVTATKRPENVQNVASSVYVATAKTLDRAEVRDFDDLIRIVPNLTITKTTQPANNSINIRGVGTYAYSIATESSTAVVVDDIPQAFQSQAFNSITDAAQVEVLRGPQSTLFGKSASAGVINITTQAPTSVLTEGVRAMVTDDHEKRINGFVSGPINDQLRFRLAAGADDYRGDLYNTYDHSWVNGHNDTNVRLKLQWTPAQDWNVTLSPYWDNTRASCCTWAYASVSPGVSFGKFVSAKNAAPYAMALGGVTPGPDNRQINADVDPRGNATDSGTGLKIEHTMGGFTLASITSFDHYDLHDDQDTEGTAINWGPGGLNVPGAVVGGSANGGWFKVTSYTEELRLTSPAADRFRYVTGFFFSTTASERSYVRGSNTLGQDGTLLTVPATTSAYSTYMSRAWDTNYALYGQSNFDITNKLSLITGARLNREEISYSLVDRFSHVSYGVPSCSTTTPSGLTASTCNSNDSLSGRAALEYHVTPNIMVFGGYDRGYKGEAYDLTSTYTTRSLVTTPGPYKGYPTADAVAAHQPISPETVNAFQLGFKSAFFAHRLIWNVTLFDEIYHNFQAQSRDQLTQQNILNSIGQVTTRGVESELSGQVTRNLTFSASGAFDEATIDNFPNSACYASQTAALGCVGGQQNLSGKPLFNAPKWNFAFNSEYDRPLADDYVALFTVGWHWQSKVIYSLLQDPDSVQKAYGLINLGAGLKKDRWKIQLFANNILNQNYALTRGRDGNWNINPYGASAGPITDAIKWTPGRDSQRYFALQLSYNY